MRWRGQDDHGATSVEYTLIAFFIAIVVAASIAALGIAVEALYESGEDAITTVGTTP